MVVITAVWWHNFDAEMSLLRCMLQTHKIASIDTEFPWLIRNTPRKADTFARYEDVKFNVARSILTQVGVTLSDDKGHIAGTWQFNLVCVDMVVDYVNCLRGQYGGVKFVKAPWMRHGVPHMVFAERFREVTQEFHGEVRWVTFHGLYDLAHLVPLFIGRPLPESLFDFVGLVERWFGRVFDIKSMAGPYRHMLGNPEYLGLEKLAAMVGVNRVGKAHQAGSDSLVTAQVFSRFINIFRNLGGPTPVESAFQLEGFLFGVSIRVVCSNNIDYLHVDHNSSILVPNISRLLIK